MKEVIRIQDFTYELPENKIAAFPLSNRDESKLLVYRHGKIEHTSFNSLPEYLPGNSFLFFNDTRVIPARLYFQKETGAEIEIFLLNPITPSILMAEVMIAHQQCTWSCTVGNLKRWKEGKILLKVVNGVSIRASLIDRTNGTVQFNWDSHHSFAEIITELGITPLPPYIKRSASKDDVERYQTVYSHYEGAVAAPTAGLHFTEKTLESLHRLGIGKDFLTLHVSAGTFQPVKVENALEHPMHHEQVIVTRKSIENLLKPDQVTIAVGTTSMRTLESLYWFGAKLLSNPDSEFNITQHDPYSIKVSPSQQEVLLAVLSHMDKQGFNSLTGKTSIFIYPGYQFKICKALITNFHLPASTLILLVAAFIGKDWRKVYEEALHHNYRFLSYGDSSLLIP